MRLVHALSLGWRTELIFARFDGSVVERKDCVVVRTPANPLYYWGNCLLLPRPPRDHELPYWLARFEDEVGCHSRETGHVAIGFDAQSPPEPLLSWQAAGFEVTPTATLALGTTDLRMPVQPLAAQFGFERLNLADLAVQQQVIELHCASDAGAHEPTLYRRHRQLQMQRYAAMQLAGLGHWFAVHHGDTLVADCGLFREGRLGRFQHVGTHPLWRRRGLGRALVERVTQHGFQQMGLEQIVLRADPTDTAIAIYEAIGYRRRDYAWGALRRPALRSADGAPACRPVDETLG